jgi:XisH protein
VAKDKYHNSVIKALEKSGWVITDDPLTYFVGTSRLAVDLGAESLIAAVQQGQKIALEIKVFADDSLVHALHLAVGQYLIYRLTLGDIDPERILYLAVPNTIYDVFFDGDLAKRVVAGYGIKIVVFDPEKEVIVSWH